MATITKLAQYDDGKGLTQKEAIFAANRMGSRILANKEFDKRLVLSDTWKSEKEVYPAWTGTLVAFGKKDAKLGDVVKYTDSNAGITYIFEVPKEYQNERNAILVVNHGFSDDGNARILPNEKGREITYNITEKSEIAIITRFPSSNGWYCADNKFGIPLGVEIPSDNRYARYLYKVENYVGLLARGGDFGGVNRWYVGAGYRPSGRFGVLINTENARMDAPKPDEKAGTPKAGATPRIVVATTGEMKQVVAKANEEAAKFGDGALENVKKVLAWAEQQLGTQ